MKQTGLLNYQNYFFIGIGGTGMSAIAQYLSLIRKKVSGSDRIFNDGQKSEIEEQLQKTGINCYKQDGLGISPDTQLVVISTAVEESNSELCKARQLNIHVVHRSIMLKAIAESKKTIAVSGTSGKSTTAAMLFHILHENNFSPSLITGAGLIDIQERGFIGNCFVGESEILIIEADESDGTLTEYKPETGIILNIDKDHKEITELFEIFRTFSGNVQGKLVINGSHRLTGQLTDCRSIDFGYDCSFAYRASAFRQSGFSITFKINDTDFSVPVIGQHNMENALAAVAAANQSGVCLAGCASALRSYRGIYRRNQIIGEKNGCLIIDDYAHNPVKIAAAIRACQSVGKRVIAFFQPHGYTPTKFLRNEYISEISDVLHENDEIWMCEIYFAGGTVKKDISSKDLIDEICKNQKSAYFVENREGFPALVRNKIRSGDVLLLMGARDATLSRFAEFVFDNL